jgi:multidrug transporter EmrE-like cation transporter
MQYILLIASLALSVTAQILLKKGVMASSLSFSFESVIKTILSPLVFAGFVLYGLSAVIWLFVLQKLPLSVAYPAFALTYVIVVVVGALFLHEQISLSKTVGIGLILIGVIVLFR